MIDPRAYNITIRHGEFEGEMLYEARVKELPDLAEYGETADEAYALVVDAIETAMAAYADRGRAFPPPLQPTEDFSGRVTLRLPKSLHRSLVQMAEDEGVSLNQHLVNVLSYFSGFAAGRSVFATGEESPWKTVPESIQSSSKGSSKLTVVRCEYLRAVG